jgi:hypothetical protein
MRLAIVGNLVGFAVGKFALPDMGQPSGVNILGSNCRECRVFKAGETPAGFRIPEM